MVRRFSARSLRSVLPVLAIAVPATASAYTVKTSSSGAPVHWTTDEVEFVSAFTPRPANVSIQAAQAATVAAVATWQTALDGSALSVVAGSTAVTAAPHHNDGINSVRWALDKTDPDIEHGVLALTFVAYRVSDGVITDADVVLNAADFTWTTAMTNCKHEFDLEAALTHELGHALGLAHSVDHPEATMFATGTFCEATKRDLAADDLDGLAALYPVVQASADDDKQVGGCSVGSSGRSGSSGSGGLAVMLGVALLVARRRRAAAAAAGLVVLGLAGHAQASQLRHIALADLGHDASLVVRGHVVAVTTLPGEALETDSEIRVEGCLAGSCPRTVHVIRRGGERDGVGLWVDGEAAPAAGADVVVYLRSDTRGRLHVLGGVQGLLRVVATPQGTVAVRDLRDHHVLVDGTWQQGKLEVVRLDDLARSLAVLKR